MGADNNVFQVEQQPLAVFTEKAYLDYSMYVILDRALPHLGDGLKPVQRRIIYAMSELGLRSTAKHKKSARTIGDVLGKYHPHGDSACYEAMVLMAQPFSYRYPFIDGQGNWGSPDDPKSFAAMRYTEARLTAYAQTLLNELGQGTVEWGPNFDGTLEEPLALPARLPNVLLNGSTGIAVGMSTDIPSHNLTEVAKACLHLLKHPNATLDDIMTFLPAPDFPTQAEIITPLHDIKTMYENGYGSIRMRAVFHIEDGEIVITSLPHQVSGAKVIEQIAQQMQAKKLPNVSDLRDESDHENPTRIVISPRSNRIDADQLMSHLFATTNLEQSYRVNFNIIGLDGRPQVKPLLALLKEWLAFRMATVRRRLEFRLAQVDARLHILAGLLIAYLNLDEVIRIIRENDEPKPLLMQRFNLSDKQADSILDTKLRHLAKLEEMKIKSEQEELLREKAEIECTLQSETKLKNLIHKEIKEDMETYGDARQSPLVTRQEAQAISERDMLPTEPMTVVLSKQGWIRAAKGHDIDGPNLSYKAGDQFLTQLNVRSSDDITLLDSTGRSYTLAVHTLPSARGQGDPITSKLKPLPGAQFHSLLTGENNSLWLLCSDHGYGFVCTLEELNCKNRSGKVILKLNENSVAMPALAVTDLEAQYVAIATTAGYLLVFPLADLPQLARGKGNKMIGIPSAKLKTHEEYVAAVTLLRENSTLVVESGKRHLNLKPADVVHFQGERGQRGHKLPRGFSSVDKLSVLSS